MLDELQARPSRDETDLLFFNRFWLFGATSAAEPVVDYLEGRGKHVVGFIDNRAAVLGEVYRGLPLVAPAQWLRESSNTDAILIVSAHQVAIATQLIHELDIAPERVFPYVSDMFIGSFGRHAIASYGVAIEQLWEGLADEESRSYLHALLAYRWTMDARLLKPNPRLAGMYLYDAPQTRFCSNDVVVDAGAFDGNTAGLFLERVGPVGKVYAIEGFTLNFDSLLKRAAQACWGDRVVPILVALSDVSGQAMEFTGDMAAGDARARATVTLAQNNSCVKSMTLDDLFGDSHGDKVAWLKLDIEGAEAVALKGGMRLLARDKPCLIVALYHRPQDLWQLPHLLRTELNQRGPYFLGHHPAAYYEPELFIGNDSQCSS
jgi:FkbM family methyltransferase